MAIDKIELENVKTIAENTTDIPSSDVQLFVTTGYQKANGKLLGQLNTGFNR